MKKVVVLLCAIALLCAGLPVTALANESAAEDFLVYDGILEEYVGAGGDIVIPESLGVKEIATRAFAQNTDITSVVIPEGVEVIGESAFSGCASLELVTLPYSLEELGTHAFSSTAITKITIPGQVAVISYGAFSVCEYLAEINISYGVEEILPIAFTCTAAERIVFPETVELICGSAFSNNKNADARRLEYVICNPNCEIGAYTDTSRTASKHEWSGYMAPWDDNKGDREHRMIVPEGSKLAEKLNGEFNEAWMKANSDSGKSDTYKVVTEKESYFEELPENQENFGIQKPEDNKMEETPSDVGTNPEENGNKGATSNNQSNKKPSNGGEDTVYVTKPGDNSMASAIIIVGGIFGGVMLIGIISVVILVATGKLGGSKKNEEVSELEKLKSELEQLKNEKKENE